MEKEAIERPSLEDETLLNDIMDDSVDEVSIKGCKKKYKIGWLKKGAIRKYTSVLMKDKDDDTLSCKCAAIIILNGYWKIKFLYWMLWRWFFYIRQYSDEQLVPIIATGKKKVPSMQFLISTILMTEMRDTMMTMTKEEAERFRQGLPTEKPEP
jgi:hypothetical protein